MLFPEWFQPPTYSKCYILYRLRTYKTSKSSIVKIIINNYELLKVIKIQYP